MMKHLQANKKDFTAKELAEIKELQGMPFMVYKRLNGEMYLRNEAGREITLPDNPEYEMWKWYKLKIEGL